MKVTISGRRMEIEDRLKAIIEKKLGKLDKFFREGAESKVTVTAEKNNRYVMEVTVYSGGTLYRAEENTDDVFAAVDKTVTVIERQIRRNKTRLEKRLKATAFDISNFDMGTDTIEEKDFNIVRTKHLSLKPMSPEEAILQMNLLGHSFFLFKSDTDQTTNLVYKRNDKDYGIIEIE